VIKAFHIEDPKEVKDLDLKGRKKIGVTAGASTPRWLINQTIEQLENIDKHSIRGIVRRTAKFFVYSYLILSLGAAALSYVFTTYMQIPSSFAQALIAFLYVYALYNINVYFFRDTLERNKLEYSRFLHKNKIWLLSTTTISLAGVLILSYYTGILSFIAIVFSILLGILFNVKLFSGSLSEKGGVKSLRDIPGSKDIFTPLALGTVIVLAPALSVTSSKHHIQDVIISFFLTAALIFLRSTLLHLIDIEEDRIVGRDTIPAYLGEKTTIKIVTNTAIFFIFALIFLSITGIGWSGVWLFSLNTIALLIMIRLFFKRVIMSYFLFSLVLDLNLILAGGVAYLGKMFY